MPSASVDPEASKAKLVIFVLPEVGSTVAAATGAWFGAPMTMVNVDVAITPLSSVTVRVTV